MKMTKPMHCMTGKRMMMGMAAMALAACLTTASASWMRERRKQMSRNQMAARPKKA